MPYSRPPRDKAAALVTGTMRIDSDTAAAMIHVPASTIRRWRADPATASDSEVASYVGEKMREMSVLAAENAEDAGVAARELILARRAKDAQHMTITAATWIDKARLLTGAMDAHRTIEHTSSTPHPALVPPVEQEEPTTTE
jgi:hypothetical protein